MALAALQMRLGYNQSVRPCQSGLTLNVDITFAAFVKAQPLASFIAQVAGFANKDDLKCRPLNKRQVNMVNGQIRGMQVGGIWTLGGQAVVPGGRRGLAGRMSIPYVGQQ